MGQVTIYLEDEVEEKMSAAVKSAGVSKSRWISRLISDKLANDWPQSVVDMSGSWKDFPALDKIRQDQSDDLPREKF
ncbi:MAG: CopG family transcriptional regulator [Gammaproteobacteria bacterium]|nr:CopG family transcriptional regulator [Gammaproteobacteria bacterium]MBJ55716.1 CopG family transcriptional regulator [Gammaproteobacteria bacterium]HBN14319.1 CopG family transcriptional regulator [Pseudohongiella sp.]|tara:strand:+ start:1698 stop:1928 length:231 start_codon:yes stop_codon:yes gene_type:complete